MSEYQIETRRRSRSKTPFLRSTCDHENCDHVLDADHLLIHAQNQRKNRAKTPAVRTIIEEEVTSSSSPNANANKSAGGAQLKIKTSDYSSEETSPENKARKSLTKEFSSANATSSTSSTMFTSSSTVVTKKVTKIAGSATILERENNMTTSTPKYKSLEFQQNFTQDENKQNELNATQERAFQQSMQQSYSNSYNKNSNNHILNNSNNNKSNSHNRTRSFNSTGGSLRNSSHPDLDPKEHLPYIEYITAGEYWNVTPKTDYTYSELSPHRRELAPGVVAMPNMSRRSLVNYGERVDAMIRRYPENESYIRRLYQQELYSDRNEFSGDEVDETITRYQVSWWRRFINSILTIFTSIYYFITNKNDKKTDFYQEAYYRKYYGHARNAESNGFFSKIRRSFVNFYSYLLTILGYGETSTSTQIGGSRRRSCLWLLLLLLLPWLLLGAFYWRLGEEDSRNYIRQIAATLPLTSLVKIKNIAWQKVAAVKEYIPTPSQFYHLLHSSAKPSNEKLHDLETNVQKALSKAEYEQLLNHVNNYMHELVDLKLQVQEQKLLKNLNTAQVELIVQVMRNNLKDLMQDWTNNNKNEQLSESQIQNLVLIVQNKLKDSGWQQQHVKWSEQDLDKIQLLIKEQLEQHNHEHYNLLVKNVDLQALLQRILGAEQFTKFVDERVFKINKQNDERWAEMQQQIAQMKLTYAENENLQQSLNNLQVSQLELSARLQAHELATSERFSSLLAEIEDKLKLLRNETFSLLNKQVKLTLVEILGFKSEDIKEADLENWVRNTFVAKQYLEQRLLEVQNNTFIVLQGEVDRTAAVLMRDISQIVKKETLSTIKILNNSTLNDTRVREIVAAALKKYDADKTGLADFALESAGGEVLSTRCTESYQVKSAQISVFGIPLWYPSNTPRVAISPAVQPGNCWAFQGFPGYLVLKLTSLIRVTGFSMEHIPKSLAPTGNIQSAPKNFTVWGLQFERDQDPVLFGEYEYEDNDVPLQYFPVQNEHVERPYEIVELRIETNHGNPKYTCLYRFRVHGMPLTS